MLWTTLELLYFVFTCGFSLYFLCNWFWKLKYTDCVTLGQFATGYEFDGRCPDDYQLVACNTYTPGAAVDAWYMESIVPACYVRADNGENQYATSICCQFRELGCPTPAPTS